jgi:hypothetical protein
MLMPQWGPLKYATERPIPLKGPFRTAFDSGVCPVLPLLLKFAPASSNRATIASWLSQHSYSSGVWLVFSSANYDL